MKRLVYLWAVVSCAACVLLASRAWRQRSETAEQRVKDEDTVQRVITDRVAVLDKIAAATAQLNEALAKLPSPAAPKKPTELSDKERFDRGIAQKKRSPQEQERARKIVRRLHQEEYGDLFAELHLPPEKLEQLKRLLVEEYSSYADAAEIVVKSGGSSFGPLGENAAAQAKATVEDDIRALLGPEAYGQYAEYQRVSRDLHRVDEFQGALAEKNLTALTPAQLRVLATAYSDVADPSRNSRAAEIEADRSGVVVVEQILERIGTALSPEQVLAFRAYRAEKYAAQEASEAVVRGNGAPD